MSLFHRLLVGGLMTLGLIIGGGITVSAVWEEPVGAPPGDNVLAPLNQATQFIGGSGFEFNPSTYTGNAANSTVTLNVKPCPAGQAYLSNGTTWACGAAGGSQNLLQVLNNGADASLFTGGDVRIGNSSADTSLMVTTKDNSAVWGMSYGSDGVNIGIAGGYNFAGVIGIASGINSYSGYFNGGRGVAVISSLTTLPNDVIGYFQNTADHANMFIDAAANKESNIAFGEGGANLWSIGTDFTTNRLRVRGVDFGAEALSILPNGKVGIGEVNPSAQFEVKPPTGVRAGYFDGEVYINNKISFPYVARSVNGQNDGGNFIMTSNNNADLAVMAQDNLYLVIDEEPDVPGGDLVVTKDVPNKNSPLLIVKNNGNVGIGVSDPVNKLDVDGKVGVRALQFASIPAPAAPTPVAGTMYYDSTLQKFRCVEQNLTVVNCVSSGGSYNQGPNISISANTISVVDNPVFSGSVTAAVMKANTFWVDNGSSLALFTLPAGSQSVWYRLPSSVGSPGAVLTNDGSGLLSWSTPAASGPWTKTGANIHQTNLTDNVGIGTANPSFPTGSGLGVYNAAAARIKLGDSTSAMGANDGVELIYDNQAWLWNRENTKLSFGTNNAERLTILQNGKVGIATSNPSASLHIGNADPQGATTDIKLAAGNQTWNIIAVNPLVGSSFGGSLIFNNGAAGVLTIASNSNVGIGTFTDSSSISHKLTVAGSGKFTNYVSIDHSTPQNGGGLILTGVPGSNPRVAFGNQNPADTSRLWIADNYHTGPSAYNNVFRIFPQQGAGVNNNQWGRSFTMRGVGTAPSEEAYVGLANPNPNSKLQIGIPNNGVRDYLQIDAQGGVPADACNATSYGRMILSHTNNRLYICSSGGWGWTGLNFN